MKLRIINGPNLNMLGVREPEIYGRQSYADLEEYIARAGAALHIEVACFQSNHEGELVTLVQQARGAADGIILNAAAYTHTSIALLDALKAVALPAVEVHLSDVNQREEFRRISYPAMACKTVIAGHGFAGYKMAMEYLVELLATKR
ncbi:MAG: type II 3-dehydroquinate dehydratase [Oscillospiraceae bacterium]|jgi:3-dehydroquinate dehydratase-2|nr:type II 3-dehydroquinate dehydratase [Oscillospiraceae bacterium]